MRFASCHHATHVRSRLHHSTWFSLANLIKAEEQRLSQVPRGRCLENNGVLVGLWVSCPERHLFPVVRWACCLERHLSQALCCRATRLLLCPAPLHEPQLLHLEAHHLNSRPQLRQHCCYKANIRLLSLRSPYRGWRSLALLSSFCEQWCDQRRHEIVGQTAGKETKNYVANDTIDQSEVSGHLTCAKKMMHSVYLVMCGVLRSNTSISWDTRPYSGDGGAS